MEMNKQDEKLLQELLKKYKVGLISGLIEGDNITFTPTGCRDRVISASGGGGSGGAVLFPNGFEDVTESREFQHSDIGKALRLAADDVFLTLPEGQFWTEEEKGQVIVIIADAQNVGFDKTYGRPVLMQSMDEANDMVGEYCLLVTGETDGQSDFGTISSAVLKDGDEWKTAIRYFKDNSTLFPKGFNVITADYEIQASDEGKFILAIGSNINITMPTGVIFEGGKSLAIQLINDGGTFEIDQFHGAITPLIQIDNSLGLGEITSEVIFFTTIPNDGDGNSILVPISTSIINDGGTFKTMLKYLYDHLGGGGLFPNGVKLVSVSRDYQSDDAGYLLYLDANVDITMPLANPFLANDNIGIFAEDASASFNLENGGAPISMVSGGVTGEVVLLTNQIVDGNIYLLPISTSIVDDNGIRKTAIKALYDRSPFGAAASFDDVTGAERVGTSIGSVTTVDLALLMAIFAPIFPTGIRVVTSSRDWEADDVNALVVVDENCELTMPASSPFNDKEIVHIATQQYTNGATTGKFQLKNGGQFASNLYINDATNSNRLEIVKMFWSAGEGRFYPLNTAYVSTGGELKSALKYNYDNAGFRGTATLVNGTVTVNNTNIKSGWKIYVSVNTPSGTQGFLSAPVASIVDATSFVINSTNAGDNSAVNWWIVP